jgi:hypothetical protein
MVTETPIIPDERAEKADKAVVHNIYLSMLAAVALSAGGASLVYHGGWQRIVGAVCCALIAVAVAKATVEMALSHADWRYAAGRADQARNTADHVRAVYEEPR